MKMHPQHSQFQQPSSHNQLQPQRRRQQHRRQQLGPERHDEIYSVPGINLRPISWCTTVSTMPHKMCLYKSQGQWPSRSHATPLHREPLPPNSAKRIVRITTMIRRHFRNAMHDSYSDNAPVRRALAKYKCSPVTHHRNEQKNDTQ